MIPQANLSGVPVKWGPRLSSGNLPSHGPHHQQKGVTELRPTEFATRRPGTQPSEAHTRRHLGSVGHAGPRPGGGAQGTASGAERRKRKHR